MSQQPRSWAAHAERVLTNRGHPASQARHALLSALDRQATPQTAIEIEDELRASGRPIARASIYRNLDQLAELNLVQKIRFAPKPARYQPRRTNEPRQHFICQHCGAIQTIIDPGIERALRNLRRRAPMHIKTYEIILRGTCQTCAEDDHGLSSSAP